MCPPGGGWEARGGLSLPKVLGDERSEPSGPAWASPVGSAALSCGAWPTFPRMLAGRSPRRIGQNDAEVITGRSATGGVPDRDWRPTPLPRSSAPAPDSPAERPPAFTSTRAPARRLSRTRAAVLPRPRPSHAGGCQTAEDGFWLPGCPSGSGRRSAQARACGSRGARRSVGAGVSEFLGAETGHPRPPRRHGSPALRGSGRHGQRGRAAPGLGAENHQGRLGLLCQVRGRRGAAPGGTPPPGTPPARGGPGGRRSLPGRPPGSRGGAGRGGPERAGSRGGHLAAPRSALCCPGGGAARRPGGPQASLPRAGKPPQMPAPSSGAWREES